MGAIGEVHERDEDASRAWSGGRRQNSMDSEGMSSRAASSCSSRACGVLSFEVCSGARGRKEPSLLAEVSGQKGSG